VYLIEVKKLVLLVLINNTNQWNRISRNAALVNELVRSNERMKLLKTLPNTLLQPTCIA